MITYRPCWIEVERLSDGELQLVRADEVKVIVRAKDKGADGFSLVLSGNVSVNIRAPSREAIQNAISQALGHQMVAVRPEAAA